MKQDESPKVPPSLVGFNVDLESNSKQQKYFSCKVCGKSLNVKSMARHLRDLHNHVGDQAKTRNWSSSDNGVWIKKAANANMDATKRKAAGNLSPLEDK